MHHQPSEDRRYPYARLQIARPKSSKEHNKIKFDEKFANSYYACVSSPRSYRRKRSNSSSTEFANVEDVMRRNIHEYRQKLADYNDRLQSQETLINIPVLRAVRNLALLDQNRTLQVAMETWKKFMFAKRDIEHHNRTSKKVCRANAENFAKDCIGMASKLASEVLLASRPSNKSDEAGKRELKILRWHKSKSTHNTTCLDGASGDGRASFYKLPAPDLSRYKSSHRNYDANQSQPTKEWINADHTTLTAILEGKQL